LKDSFSLREIGRRLGRSHTSISRELKRNGAPEISTANVSMILPWFIIYSVARKCIPSIFKRFSSITD
jgi:hypothetical protein